MSSAKAEADGQAWRDRFHSSSDGLSLHIAEYGDPSAPWLPVVCLPGLSRSARDFHNLAVHLSTHRHRPRRVLAFDYRGRGLSQWDKDIANYNPLTELTDVLDGMSALGIGRAIVVGTSRGGIIAMMMGVARPHAVAGVVLNDIGPVIEPVGLARIKTYIGRTPAPDDWDDAIHIIKRLHGGQFTALGDAEWEAFARATYRDEDGRPAANYDPALAKTFDGIEFDRPIPELWKEFATLSGVPMLAIRGGNSDLLSAETLVEMGKRHPGLESVTIEGEGHPPLLLNTPILQRISVFITQTEGSGPPADAVIPVDRPGYDPDTRPED
ncbi:MAG: alpha/beta hydrolase [Bauldia sp.]|uniref:alpha/beta fold hydrolase n=1 Tax=Bauldia sp. TaxID=2575872 RepID=UPI001DC8FCFF|nr:alpha/beta hydrolase [Bauldia sp.]MCB1496848.1 alpha/beta hydrolase [Bauldia sp.]